MRQNTHSNLLNCPGLSYTVCHMCFGIDTSAVTVDWFEPPSSAALQDVAGFLSVEVLTVRGLGGRSTPWLSWWLILCRFWAVLDLNKNGRGALRWILDFFPSHSLPDSQEWKWQTVIFRTTFPPKMADVSCCLSGLFLQKETDSRCWWQVVTNNDPSICGVQGYLVWNNVLCNGLHCNGPNLSKSRVFRVLKKLTSYRQFFPRNCHTSLSHYVYGRYGPNCATGPSILAAAAAHSSLALRQNAGRFGRLWAAGIPQDGKPSTAPGMVCPSWGWFAAEVLGTIQSLSAKSRRLEWHPLNRTHENRGLKTKQIGFKIWTYGFYPWKMWFNQHTWCHPKVGMSTAKKPSSRPYFLGFRLRGMELVPFVVEIALGLGKHAESPLITCCSHLYPLITFCH